MIKDFSSLHGHSHFSLFDGLSTPEENVKAAKAKGLRSIALTDHGVAHGHADLYLSGKKHGVRVVFGVEAYVIHSLKEWNALREKVAADKADKTMSEMEKTNAKELRRKGHLVLLACNRKGLSNLNVLVYRAHRDGFYGKPRMDKEMLREHAEGLVASSACMGGVISKVCWDVKDGKATWDDVVREAKEFDSIFGRGHFYLEIQLNEHEGQRYINECMVRISNETGIPLTVTTDFHYSQAEEWEAREVLHMLDWDKTVKDFPNQKIDAEIKQLYVKSPDEMWQSYLSYGKSHIPENVILQAFENTLLIDSLVEDFEPDTHQRLPTLKGVENPFAVLGKRAIEGLRKLGLAENEKYKAQLLHELKVIKDKGISEYFLILNQIIGEASKSQFIGAGRGSAAGSLVCYALGITDYDPVANDLMFERFLDPNRAELPDIDVDFEDVDETKDMLRRMFGNDNVACLSTYGTFQIKGLLKDLARVYDLDHTKVNVINKMIEKELKVLYINQDKSTIVIKLEDIERVSPTYRKFIADNPELATHIKRLYGRNRHIGRHASGVIIGDNLSAETSIFCSGKEGEKVVQTSFTEGIVNKNLSAMGFVKFDILSIATLKILRHACELVAQKEGVPLEVIRERIRAKNMDLNDSKVLKRVFWDGNFAGVFQFTEKGIRNLAQKVKPDTFTDVSAICSIYRPGPLGGGFDKLYVHNKFNPDDVKYDHPLLESILKPTRGCIVFQEQLMKICNVMGKMSWKDVNAVRKVLLKKDKSKSEEFLKSENDRLRAMFLKGCEENGFPSDKATDLWEKLLKFGGYGFNKAHSDTYSLMTMQCAYLATYHPMEFYAAVLTKGQSGDMQQYVGDIKRAGVEILPVDINASKLFHVKEGNGIRLSFRSVLGVGPAAIEKIMANQPYTDFIDFLDRSGATKTAITPLIKVGAFDSICKKPMKELEWKYLYYANNPKLKTKKMRDEWLKLWDSNVWGGEVNNLSSSLGEMADYKDYEKVAFENELMGFSVRGSPFEILDRKEKIESLLENNQLMKYEEFLEDDDATIGRFAVLLKDRKEKPQRNGQLMAWLKFETMEGQEFEAPAFGGIWKHIRGKMVPGIVYIGTFNRKPEDPTSLLVGKPGFAHSAYSASESMISLDT